MSWIIYKHTNKINGKVYIGQTKQSAEGRWKNGLGYFVHGNVSVFARAIIKYGWDSFEHEIIEDKIKSQDIANEREIYWISFYKSYVGFPNCNGYNMTLGGDTGNHLGHGVFQIRKSDLSIVKEFPSLAEASRFFGNNEKSASSIRDCCEGTKVSAKGFYWCYVSNYSQNWKPKDNQLLSPVLQLDDELEVIRRFASIAEANQLFGYSRGSIVSCCRRKQRKASGFYWCYERDFNEDWKPITASFFRNEKIYCFETDCIYESAKAASIATGANVGHILRCCKKLEKGASGLHFCFPKDKEGYVMKNAKKRADRFSEEELKLLRNYYPKIGTNVVKMLPKRTERSISQQAHRMRLVYNGPSKAFKSVLCVEKNLVFQSVKDAKIWAGLKNGSSISQCCNGHREKAAGYHWKYINEKE